MTTSSDRAAKLFDAALSQYVAFRDYESFGGLYKTLEDLKNADPEFVLGRVMSNTISLIWINISPGKNPDFRKDVELTFDIAARSKDLTSREKSHVKALKMLYEGFKSKARDVWEQILLDHPTDALALKFLHDGSIVAGDKLRLRNLVERAFGAWRSSLPLYGYLYGMKAFALCENGDYVNSEAAGEKGLELIPTDIWSTHALAHDYEMTGQYVKGQKFLESTVKNWEPCNTLTRHVHWHNAVYSVEKGDFEKAMGIFDDKVLPGLKESVNAYEMVDACSLLYRLQFQGIEVGDRFGLIHEQCLSHLDDHLETFSDLHNLMTALGSGHRSDAEKFCQDLRKLVASYPVKSRDYIFVSGQVGIPVSEAMVAYDKGQFNEAVEWLEPIQEVVVKMGGSDAQRDIFSQLLLNAAINSSNPEHQQFAEDLLKKRKQAKEDSPLTDRLVAKLLAVQQKRS